MLGRYSSIVSGETKIVSYDLNQEKNPEIVHVV